MLILAINYIFIVSYFSKDITKVIGCLLQISSSSASTAATASTVNEVSLAIAVTLPIKAPSAAINSSPIANECLGSPAPSTVNVVAVVVTACPLP